jgi:hypothetical protein
VSEIVFVLGAGASVHTGAPVMATFLENARLISKGITVKPWKDDFDRVFNAINELQRVHSKASFDIHNLESVFTILETARTVGKLPGFEPAQIPQVLDSFKSVITYTLDRTTEFPADPTVQPGGVRILPSYDYLRFVQLLEKLRDGRSGFNGVTIITFNYDIALDFAIRTRQMTPNYALQSKQPLTAHINLLKLHGSLNWGRTGNGEEIVYLAQLESFATDCALSLSNQHRANLPVGTNLPELMQKYQGIAVEAVPVIVPPGFYKAEEHEALTDVWKAAAQQLSDAEDIIVIGFSLPTTDSFFNHLYGLGTEGASTIRKFWVFNPDTEGTVEKRFRAMLGFGASPHFHYFPLRFDQAVDEIAFQYYGEPTTSVMQIVTPIGPRNYGPAIEDYPERPLKPSSQVR